MNKEIHKLSALELSSFFKSKIISPMEVAKVTLERVEKTQHER